MIRDKKIFFFGVLLFILPFLGFPLWWKFAFVIALALVFISLAVDFSRFDLSKLPHLPGTQSTDFSENFSQGLAENFEQDFREGFVKEEPIVASMPTHISSLVSDVRPVADIRPKRVYRPRKKKVTDSSTMAGVGSIDY